MRHIYEELPSLVRRRSSCLQEVSEIMLTKLSADDPPYVGVEAWNCNLLTIEVTV
jgi:hypothetical protein